MSERQHVLVATLGGQPQIVTFTLDLLLKRGYPITEVIVLHPNPASQPRLQNSLQRLEAEFSNGYYRIAQRSISFSSCILEYNGQPIDDIMNDQHADGTLESIYHLIGDLKRRACCIHLSASGGRRLISLLAVSVAFLNFDRHDYIWHIYTPDSLTAQAKEQMLMHLPTDVSDQIQLIQGSFPALGKHMYTFLPSRLAQEEQRSELKAQEYTRCAELVEKATPAQLKVLQTFAQGLRPQQVAEELAIKLVTVHTHKAALLSYCHQIWNIPNDEHLDYHFLYTKFSDYFQDTKPLDTE